MQNRPAVKILIPYLFGIILADKFNFNLAYLWILSAVLIISAFIIYKKRWLSSSSGLIALFLILAGFFRYEVDNIPPRGLDGVMYQYVKIRGTVIGSEKETSGGSTLILKAKAVSDSDAPAINLGKISVRSWDYVFPYIYGDVVELEGRLSRPRPLRNPGVFDYRKYLERRGIYVTMTVNSNADIWKVSTAGNPFLRWIRELRRKIEIVIDEIMPFDRQPLFKDISLNWHLYGAVLSTSESASVLKGVILGDQGVIPENMYQAFIRTSIVHILSVSGLHIGIIAGWAFFLFNWIRKLAKLEKTVIVYIPVTLLIIIYACMIGFNAPVVRSSVFVILVIISVIINRDLDLFNPLAIAAMFILVYHPGTLWDVGFQLSFGAMASITYLMPFWGRLLAKIKRDRRVFSALYRIFQSVAVSLSAQIGTMLIIAYIFRRISLIGTIVNPIIIPIVGIIVPLGFISIITGFIYLPLASLLGYLNHLLISLLRWIVCFFADLRFSDMPVRGFSFWYIIAVAALIVLIVNLADLLKQRRRLIIAGISLAAIFIWAAALSYDGHILKVTYLDVGQGDSIFLDLPDGRNILIDGGPYSVRFDAGKRLVSPFLQREGINKLDLLVSTHPHNDHVGGLTYIVDNFRVDKVITGGYGLTTPTYDIFCSLLNEKGIEYHDAEIDSILKDKKLHIEVISPQSPDTTGNMDTRMNNNSVVLRVTYKKASFLFAGDIQAESERALVSSGRDIRTAVLKVPHQGSETSSSWEFLRAVQPSIGVISVGQPNFSNHPSRLILGRYRWLGIKTYRTDLQGAITVLTDGRRGWIKTMIEPG